MTTITRIGKAHWQERGERIEKARKFAGLSQEQLADAVTGLVGYKVGRQVIYTIEQGDRDIRGDELKVIAVVVGQSEDWLDGREGATFNDEPIIYGLSLFPWFRRPIDFQVGQPKLKVA